MRLSLYEKTTGEISTTLMSLVAANLAFALVSVLAWPQVAGWIEPGVIWSVGVGVGEGHPRAFEYPFLAIWMVPAFAGIIGWLLLKCEAPSLAWPIVLSPSLYAILVVVAMWAERAL